MAQMAPPTKTWLRNMVLPTIKGKPFSNIINIPAMLIAGLFFCGTAVRSESLQLAADFFEEGRWEHCLRECRRGLISGQDHAAEFRLFEALSLARIEPGSNRTLARLKSLQYQSNDLHTASLASYELGRQYWLSEAPESAFSAFEFTFYSTTNQTLWLQASCSLYQLTKEYSELKEGQQTLLDQITTSRQLWTAELLKACAKPEWQRPKKPSLLIRFYRSQISPAIGSRCSLEPSCSEYFYQASCTHGKLLAVPMISDRFIREPKESNEQNDPVEVNGKMRYRDPIANHDFWMNK